MKRPLPFILAATNNGSMIINHLDRHDTPQGSYGVGFQFLNYGSFDPEEIDLCINLLKLRREYYKDNVFAIDCGANIGAHTIKWAIEMHNLHIYLHQANHLVHSLLTNLQNPPCLS
ncbi:hypothetical protein [Campylobacter jejuni]|uniref:hypothetical protein n=1 Tax=Campylobacter jejuni TaxID=197 RepID=UPI00207C02F8|nr:hypothetical protein [Campylobacter jejuni]